MEYGPAKGRMMIQKGVEHEDTRRLLNTELASGNVRCWGRRQIINYLPLQFEDPVREIDQSYWNNMQLDFYAALYHTETVPQTAMISGRRPPAEFWTALTVSRSEIQRIWPRKSVFRRLFERATKHQRITALPN